MAVLYPSFFSFTVTRTNATREPSGEICVSPAQTKLNKSFSVTFRFCAKTGPAHSVIVIKTSKKRDRIRSSFQDGLATRRYSTGNGLKVEQRNGAVRRPLGSVSVLSH